MPQRSGPFMMALSRCDHERYNSFVSHPITITAFYKFLPLAADGLAAIRAEMIRFGEDNGMRGLVLIAEEGINGTVCGKPEVIGEWKNLLTEQFGEIAFKDSYADDLVFKRWSVKLKPEIVGLKRRDMVPDGKNGHLSPAEFHAMLQRDDVIVVDARNSYEYGIGKFAKAVDCGTERFSEFEAFAEQTDLPKDKPVLMYCTGGIRCEKASLAMQEKGFNEVYQLDGGILAYIEQFPNGLFEGECFVFDKRVAVDQHLQPSAVYDTCPHCGLPGSESVLCKGCNTEQKICSKCAVVDYRHACSKQCANRIKYKGVATASAVPAGTCC